MTRDLSLWLETVLVCFGCLCRLIFIVRFYSRGLPSGSRGVGEYSSVGGQLLIIAAKRGGNTAFVVGQVNEHRIRQRTTRYFRHACLK